jgi:hypothetical protein
LNQSAHVLRDLASMMLGLSRTNAVWPSDVVPREALLKQLNEGWVSGLYFLAFASPEATASSAPERVLLKPAAQN